MYLTCGLVVQGHKGQGQRSPGSRSKVKVVGQRSRSHVSIKFDFKDVACCISCVTYRLKATSIKVKDHWSRSNKDHKERQVGSQQRQVASLFQGALYVRNDLKSYSKFSALS